MIVVIVVVVTFFCQRAKAEQKHLGRDGSKSERSASCAQAAFELIQLIVAAGVYLVWTADALLTSCRRNNV